MIEQIINNFLNLDSVSKFMVILGFIMAIIMRVGFIVKDNSEKKEDKRREQTKKCGVSHKEDYKYLW